MSSVTRDAPELVVVGHPVVTAALTTLRDRSTPSIEFRSALRMIARALAYEATRDLPLETIDVQTPLATTRGGRLATRVIAAPILRAGIGMLESFLEIVPSAATGFLGLRRDEESLLPIEYYRNVPETDGAHLFLLDPMLATGGSVRAALAASEPSRAASISLLTILSAPEGIAAVRSHHPEVRVYTAAVDDGLNEYGFILPGLGDAGDRLWGTL